jgi:hypothetical protein
LGRAVNLALPLTLGKVVNILEGESHQPLWPYLLGYVGLRFLQGSGGLAAIGDVSLGSGVIFHSLILSDFLFSASGPQ